VEVQKEWCVALRSFAEDDDDQTWVASVGGVEAVVQAMQTHAQSAGVQRQGCRALRNLAASHAENRTRIAGAGGVESVVKALQMHAQSAGVQEEGRDALRELEQSECVVCMEHVRHADGVLCGEGHLVCRDCMEGHVQHCAGEYMRVRQQREGHVPCPCATPALGCTAAPYSDAELAQAMPAAAFEVYIRARMELVESSVREDAEREGEEWLQAELARLQALDEAQRAVLAARRYIDQEILIPHCPRCNAPLKDFDGCCALKCHRCLCAFCAWCGIDCGTDEHRHATSCSARADGADGLFPTEKQLVRFRV
jgi:hypothetical protein